MDRKPTETPEIQRLILLSEAARSRLTSDAAGLRRRLDVPGRVRESLQKHPVGWIFGSLASGLATSMVFLRKPAGIKKRRGIPTSLFGLTLTAVRPFAKIWLTNQLKNWITSLALNQMADRPRTTTPSAPKSR